MEIMMQNMRESTPPIQAPIPPTSQDTVQPSAARAPASATLAVSQEPRAAAPQEGAETNPTHASLARMRKAMQ